MPASLPRMQLLVQLLVQLLMQLLMKLLVPGQAARRP